MKITNLPISSITPYERNTKKHDATQIANVAESIKQYGFVQPIVIDKENVVVIGHCRLSAAKKLGMKEVPCVCVDDLTEEQVKALRLIDNKTNESEWDFDFLAQELDELDLSGFDIDWGMDEDDDQQTEIQRHTVNIEEKISVVVECENDEQAEKAFNELTEMGYVCRISTL